MAGDSERRAAATEDRRQQAPNSVSPWAKPAVQKRAEMRSAKCADKMASGKQNFFLPVVVTIFS
eukprot:1051618-Prymnesium_polylepis.1